jgi:hypothetical protein
MVQTDKERSRTGLPPEQSQNCQRIDRMQEALAAGEPAISADAKKDKKEVRRPPLIARLAYAINE